jgi:hypothetical protein
MNDENASQGDEAEARAAHTEQATRRARAEWEHLRMVHRRVEQTHRTAAARHFAAANHFESLGDRESAARERALAERQLEHAEIEKAAHKKMERPDSGRERQGPKHPLLLARSRGYAAKQWVRSLCPAS